ncbi:MAG: UvrD-helicase domain-containing protein [Solirubrobacteraceae bacterium]
MPAELLTGRVCVPGDLPQPMTDARWTPEQARAIERRAGDLLLDAGAGSGKTSVLVERFVKGVLEDGIEVSRMLTITFTEKAAAELRDRIRARLRALDAIDAARQTEGAFISTIHGFCARVLRSHALSAGLDPGFAVLDRRDTEPLVAAAFDDALDELAREADGAVDLIAAYGAGPLRAAIVGAHEQLRSAGQLAPRLPPAGSADRALAELALAGSRLAAAARALAAELGAVSTPGARVIESLDRVARSLELAGEADLWPTELDAVRLPRNGADLRTDACDAYAEALTAFRAACAARAAVPARDLLDGLLGAFGRHYRRRKRGVSGLDFEDLELICRDLLGGDAELHERYVARFDRIMVDELQDTNRLQLELIESIARDNLFTVGDAQQSIYGFRHAEVELFERRGRRLAAVAARETLQTNFRSRPSILAALNLAFAHELGDRFTPLLPGRPPAGDGAPAVELVLVDKGADYDLEGVASPWRLAEARALAARVAELAGQEGWAPGEIVVLMRATTERDEESLYSVLASPLVGVSLDALVVLGAAARASGRDPWWVLSSDPDPDALGALDAQDRVTLRAFAGWFADQRAGSARTATEELIDAALEQTGYDVAMLAMPGGRRRLANVRKLMRLAREHEDEHGPDLRGFLALAADREAGRTADARESEAPVEGDGLDAIRLMTIHRAKGLEFPVVCVADLGRTVRPPSELLRVSGDGRLGLRLARAGAGGREPALHYRAIGEERKAAEEDEERRLFYVAMTRAQERLVLSGATRFDGWTGEGGANGGGPVAWIAPAFVPELGEALQRGRAEIDRDGVRISVRVAPPGAAPAPALAAPAAPPSPAPVSPQPAVAPPPPTAAVPAPPALAAPPASAAPVTRAPPVRALSYSSLGEYERCGYRFYAERVLGLPAPPARAGAPGLAPGAPGARSAADRGVLIHALLERLDFRRPAVPAAAAVAAAAGRAGLHPPPGPGESDELAAVIRRFAASELCARLGRAFDARREERFAFTLGGGALIVGALDVLAREPGEHALIVDYKSDRLDGADPAAVVSAEYAVQRLVYALAALRAGAGAVDVVHCFLERPEEPVSARYAAAQRPELERSLHAIADGVLERRFAVTPAPHRALCAGCPAEGGICSWPVELTRRESPDRLF